MTAAICFQVDLSIFPEVQASHVFFVSTGSSKPQNSSCILFGKELLNTSCLFYSSNLLFPLLFFVQLFLSLTFLLCFIPSLPPLRVETHFNDTPTPGPVSPSPCHSAHAALLPSVSSPLQQPTSSTLCALKNSSSYPSSSLGGQIKQKQERERCDSVSRQWKSLSWSVPFNFKRKKGYSKQANIKNS